MVTVVTKVDHNQDTEDGLNALIKGGELTGKIGWTAQSVYPNENLTVAQAALNNEFGYNKRIPRSGKTVRIPARPALRNTIKRRSNDWIVAMQEGAKAVLNNNQSFKTVLQTVTAEAVDDVRETVQQRITPPLAPLTLELRKNRRGVSALSESDTLPLYDTGTMMKTLTNEVTDE